MKRRIVLLLAAALLAAFRPLAAQPLTLATEEGPVRTTVADTLLAGRIMKELSVLKETSPGTGTAELMVYAALRLKGQPYVAGTLDKEDPEELRVYLTQTDCILFVETCLNLALTVMDGRSDFISFASHVRQSRYRGGVTDGYASRIHYTTEWIRQGEARGVVCDLSDRYSSACHGPINYMSHHPDRYRQLRPAVGEETAGSAAARRELETIAAVEQQLSAVPQYYIPSAAVKQMEGEIRSGDIIGYMSGVPGLDIAHIAMAYVHHGKVGFIHASMAKMEVIEDPKSIADYVQSRSGLTGIKLVRPIYGSRY